MTEPSATGAESGAPAPAIGQPVHAAGEPAHATGQPVHAAGEPTHATGQPADTTGQPADTTGQPAHTTGQPEAATTAPATPARRPTWRRIVGSTWFHLAAALVITGLILSFVAKPYWVPSGSMENTLQPGDRVMVNRLAYTGANPGTGDIVVFDAGEEWDTDAIPETNPLKASLRWIGEVTGFGPSSAHTLIKRVIGTPGESVACCTADGQLTIDDEPLVEPYVFNDYAFETGSLDCTSTPRSQRCFDAVEVPADSYLMLGDNRANSSDSAAFCRSDAPADDCWRWATRPDLVGKAVLLFWPFTRWTGL